MGLISIVVNLDSRAGVDQSASIFEHHNEGCRHWDFFEAGLVNKRRFFDGFDFELIAYIDEAVRAPDDLLNRLRNLCDCVVLRRHCDRYRDCDPFNQANDIRFLHALMQARGETIVHFDADCAAFASDKGAVEQWLAHLDAHRFVSYPSQWSPRPVDDPSFGAHTWASTRAFACRRATLQFDEIEHALRDPEWMWAKYGTPPRKLGWLEHVLSRLNNDSVFYPHRDDERLLIFCWDRYVAGTLLKLNEMTYDDALAYVRQCGGIHYPNDVTAL